MSIHLVLEEQLIRSSSQFPANLDGSGKHDPSGYRDGCLQRGRPGRQAPSAALFRVLCCLCEYNSRSRLAPHFRLSLHRGVWSSTKAPQGQRKQAMWQGQEDSRWHSSPTSVNRHVNFGTSFLHSQKEEMDSPGQGLPPTPTQSPP